MKDMDLFCFALRRFIGQHCALDRQAPVIAAQGARFAQRPVARDKPADGIAPNGSANSADSFGRPNALGDI